MKKIFIIVFFNLLISFQSLANNLIYETKFYNIKIENEMISDAKIREIDKIKLLSLNSILNNLLTKKNIKYFKRTININNTIDYLIKNIIIEDEFISSIKYSANIKINFDYEEIINLLRNNRINYTDEYSSNILLIIAENNELSMEGLSKYNTFYHNLNKEKFGLLNLTYPDLSPNDRFILPFNKIINKDLNSFENIAKKYNTNFVFTILTNQKNKNIYFDIFVYSLLNKNFQFLQNIKTDSNLKYQDNLLNILNLWWKEKNIIDNSILNQQICFIKNSNIYELNFINSRINTISQVKSNELSMIKLGLNINKIFFYGDLSKLTLKLSNFKIDLYINSLNQCTISVNNGTDLL